MSDNDVGLEDVIHPKPTQQQLIAQVKSALVELKMTPADLAAFMLDNGDHRDYQTVLRGIQRALVEDTRVSGELYVIVNMLLRRNRYLKHRYINISWEKNEYGTYWTKVDDWYVYLVPQSRGRWQITCRHGLDPKDYSPPFSRWFNTFEEARDRAWAHLENGMAEEASILHNYAVLHGE